MKVPDKLFSQWTELRSQGDGQRIAEQYGLTKMDVSRAFANKECSEKVFEAIADFYMKRFSMVKKFTVR